MKLNWIDRLIDIYIYSFPFDRFSDVPIKRIKRLQHPSFRESNNSCTSLRWLLYFISIFLDWRLGFELALWLNGWNLRSPSKWNSYEGFNIEHYLWWFEWSNPRNVRQLAHCVSRILGEDLIVIGPKQACQLGYIMWIPRNTVYSNSFLQQAPEDPNSQSSILSLVPIYL